MDLTLRKQTDKLDVCLWLGYTKDINFHIDWDGGFTFKVSFLFFQLFIDWSNNVAKNLEETQEQYANKRVIDELQGLLKESLDVESVENRIKELKQ